MKESSPNNMPSSHTKLTMFKGKSIYMTYVVTVDGGNYHRYPYTYDGGIYGEAEDPVVSSFNNYEMKMINSGWQPYGQCLYQQVKKGLSSSASSYTQKFIRLGEKCQGCGYWIDSSTPYRVPHDDVSLHLLKNINMCKCH